MSPSFEKWLWIDLIGFDVDREDCAVPAFLEKTQSAPAVISLLLQNAEFVHLHARVDSRRGFPSDICSYGGHPKNEERLRQVWTPAALHRLVRVLQSHGVKVVFSVFDFGQPDGWREHHPEIDYVCRDGQRSPRICPWKRLTDGTTYEAFFVGQLQKVMTDYGFDGFHGADGYSHPRFALHEADFSDDMIEQFTADTDTALPAGIDTTCDGTPDQTARRAEWIWTRQRKAWIEFHVQRTQRFWHSVAEMLHRHGKTLALNTAWTRDPFEAVYRFGTDYQALAEAGADVFIVEAAGAVQELGGDLPFGTAHGRAWTEWDPTRILCRFQTTIMLIKAAVPDTKLVFLNGVKDTNEIWNGLRHAPTNLESEITMHGNIFIRGGEGRVSRCTDGPVVCLADGIRPEEWTWLNRIWQRSFDWPVAHVRGATVLWSDSVVQKHHDQYITSRFCPPGRLLHELVARGAPLYTIQRVDDLQETAAPLVVLHPQLYAPGELREVFARAQGPLVLIGRPIDGLPPAAATFVGSAAPDALWCGVYGVPEDLISLPVIPSEPAPGEAPDPGVEPPSWIYELPTPRLPPDFLSGCAGVVADVSDSPRVLENADSVRVWAADGCSGQTRLFIRNDAFYYRVASIDVGHQIETIEIRTEFPGTPIRPNDTQFHVKIPGKGVVIADLKLAR
ncbi:MAG: hypothetical protein HN742_21440 [Lentisphaerae bacterium]|jgi:hypothetical protein|nr:hypothetical protein [Lentisphaerota bacterium]MBT4815117.1 hypothetical protein [Lentisphaerota bacterium]MBT5613102.1 hypothetical protein [Lentisphaerota bacterium]MBT7056426.1 hypothetical protein [Lentisphaerota bacterium]MBT7844455.1 hypothetical protein [Lentisphaerota bacterium]